MSKTTQTERNGTLHTAKFGVNANKRGIVTDAIVTDAEFLVRLIDDADRLAAIERSVRELADVLESDAAMAYESASYGESTGFRTAAKKVRAIIDPPT